MRIVNPGSAGETDPASLPYAFIYKSGDSTETTTISAANTPYAINVTTTSKRLRDFTTDSAGAVTYTGSASFYAKVTAGISGGSIAAGNTRYEYVINKNGSPEEAGKQEKTSSSTIDTIQPRTCDLLIANGDVISVEVENKTNTNNSYLTAFDLLVQFERWA